MIDKIKQDYRNKVCFLPKNSNRIHEFFKLWCWKEIREIVLEYRKCGLEFTQFG